MTLYTSDTDINKTRLVKALPVYLGFTAFAAFFGAVYELFSHEVYSYYMIYAFAVPLFLGAGPFSVMLAAGIRAPGRLAFNLYNSGIAALTVGCIIKGMLDIYGTTNDLMYVYFIAGIAFIAAGTAAYFLTGRSNTNGNNGYNGNNAGYNGF